MVIFWLDENTTQYINYLYLFYENSRNNPFKTRSLHQPNPNGFTEVAIY